MSTSYCLDRTCTYLLTHSKYLAFVVDAGTHDAWPDWVKGAVRGQLAALEWLPNRGTDYLYAG